MRRVRRYDLLSKLPSNIRTQFEHPESIPETPKGGRSRVRRRAAFQILLGRHDLFHPAHRAAEAAGFVTVCDNTTDNWPVEKAVDFLLAQLGALKQANPGKSVAVIADGEVSSPVTGDGIGGRNLAFVLDCVKKIAGQRIAVLSVGTDGIDGSSPAAGAVADGETLARAQSLGTRPSRLFPAQRFLYVLPQAGRRDRNRPHRKQPARPAHPPRGIDPTEFGFSMNGGGNARRDCVSRMIRRAPHLASDRPVGFEISILKSEIETCKFGIKRKELSGKAYESAGTIQQSPVHVTSIALASGQGRFNPAQPVVHIRELMLELVQPVEDGLIVVRR